MLWCIVPSPIHNFVPILVKWEFLFPFWEYLFAYDACSLDSLLASTGQHVCSKNSASKCDDLLDLQKCWFFLRHPLRKEETVAIDHVNVNPNYPIWFWHSISFELDYCLQVCFFNSKIGCVLCHCSDISCLG